MSEEIQDVEVTESDVRYKVTIDYIGPRTARILVIRYASEEDEFGAEIYDTVTCSRFTNIEEKAKKRAQQLVKRQKADDTRRTETFWL